ncbi:MAG: hypothetical protein ACHQU0_00630 [Candidatus Paceibacteria bacterium]
MSDLMLDVGQANELKMAFRRADYSNDEIKQLCEGSILADVRNVLRKHATITMMEYVIDCDASPYVPDGWKVEEHQKGGQFKFDASQIELYLSAAQKKGSIEGNKLRKELAGKLVLNANVLDYLLANPHLIPEEWKGKYVFFWGTVYRFSDGILFVRYLFWRGGRWLWGSYWLDNGWDGRDPAALRAS